MDSFVGKTLKNEKDEEYIVLTELEYKNIPCVYAMKVEVEDKEGPKQFFQVTSDKDIKLVNIKSKRMINALNECLFEKTKTGDVPRKIKNNESISDYLAYLDDFYKTKVVTIM